VKLRYQSKVDCNRLVYLFNLKLTSIKYKCAISISTVIGRYIFYRFNTCSVSRFICKFHEIFIKIFTKVFI